MDGAVFAGARDPEFVGTLNPRLPDFTIWLTEHRGQFRNGPPGNIRDVTRSLIE